MWSVQNLINNINPPGPVSFSDGQSINTIRGGAGNCYRLITSKGFLDFTDTGNQPGGPAALQLILNGYMYWYNGTGGIVLTLNNDGSFSVNSDGNNFTSELIPLPDIDSLDISNLDWMINNKFIPYQDIPDEPGKTTQQIIELGLQYFPFSTSSFELAMSIYDWTTADFTRIDFFRMFVYTDVVNTPLDLPTIANSIWTANWPPYVPQNVYYMNSFMMQPANSLQEVQQQLNTRAQALYTMNQSQVNLLTAAMRSMPRTSCLSVPALYSGQVDVSNLGTQHFAAYFLEFPNNSNSNLPLEMSLQDALNSFIQVGRILTLKGVMSFTDSLNDAMHYSNGIVLIVSPPAGAYNWYDATYITPLSDGPEKTEYLFHPYTIFLIDNIVNTQVNGKPIVEIYLSVIQI